MDSEMDLKILGRYQVHDQTRHGDQKVDNVRENLMYLYLLRKKICLLQLLKRLY